ncbi:diguanylate cyclase [bacterium]|nr:diguanylate cyclase [bacterium]
MKMKVNRNLSSTFRYLGITMIFLIIVNTTLGVLLTSYASKTIRNLINTRMLDISNTAADMLDGDILRNLSPKDKGTPEYESVMKTLTYFQNNIDLKYIYCIRDKGNKEFVFGLDPTVKDPGEFDSPIVYTDALYKASQGTASVDATPYKDAWGEFYSAYSPVFDSKGEVACIVAVDFSKEWCEDQIAVMIRTTVIVSIMSLIVGGAIIVLLTARNIKRIRLINEQVNELADSFGELRREIKNMTYADSSAAAKPDKSILNEQEDIDSLKNKISAIQNELRSQITKIHEQVYIDDTTGVMNKACYINMKKRIEASIGGDNSNFSIIICDMNGLKTINDTFGHEIGDIALKDIAKVLISVYKQKNVFRIGGDEFIVVSEDISEDVIKESFESVSESLSSINSDEKPYHVPLSISMGYAVYQKDEDNSFADVFRRADKMMYSNKSAYYMRRGDRRRKN